MPARDELITLSEAASITDMSVETLRVQARRRRDDGTHILRTVMVGMTRLTTPAWIEDYKTYIDGRSPRSKPLPPDWEERAQSRPARPPISLTGGERETNARDTRE